MTSDKILVIGIDGGTWDVLGPACDRGWMSHLDRFRREGCWGTLRSTHPPITPAAWVSFMTGQNPGRHGVLGFQEYDPATNKVGLTSSRSIRTETLWQKLSRQNKSMVIVNVPMTYPPLEVNGILVSGLETPSTDVDFTAPAPFKHEIMEKVPDFTFARRYRRKQLTDKAKFGEFLNWLKRQSEQVVEILSMGMEKQPWDVGMVLLRSFDEMLHYFWGFLDFSQDFSHDRRSEIIEQYFRDLDEIIGRILRIAEVSEAQVCVLSDHGGQAKRGNMYPNRLLRKLGYLKDTGGGGWELLLDRLSRKFRRRRLRDHPMAKSQERDKRWDQIDWSKTRAYITEVNIYANLYLHLKGRQPDGIVSPCESEALLDELIEVLGREQGPDGESLFPMVERPRSVYGLGEGSYNLPDIIIAPREGYLMRPELMGHSLMRPNKKDPLSGTHSMNGMFALMGTSFHAGRQMEAQIIDIAPTILAAMNLPVTQDMDGRVLTEAFNREVSVTSEPSLDEHSLDKHHYTRQEEQEISERLADLGYL